MAVKAQQGVSVGTSAVRLDTDENDEALGHGIAVIPQSTGTLIFGGSTVTAGNGARIAVTAGVPLTFELGPNEKLYAIVAAGTLVVDVLGMGE